MTFVQNLFFAFFDSKNAQIKKKRPSILVLFNVKQLLFYEYPPKNASKYPKIGIFKITILEKIGFFWPVAGF